MINFNNVKIFSGNSNVELAKKIAEKADIESVHLYRIDKTEIFK